MTEGLDQQIKVWVEHDRHHTAILLPREMVLDRAPELRAALQNPTGLQNKAFVRFGWGDRDYYGSSQKNIYKLLKALLLPTRSVVEVSSFAKPIDAGRIVIPISDPRLDTAALIDFIKASFYLKSEGPQLIREEAGGFRYYRARGIYWAGKNCNNWTAKALKKAGLELFYWRAVFPRSVINQLPGPHLRGRLNSDFYKRPGL